MAGCSQELPCRVGCQVENDLSLRKDFFSNILSVNLNRHSQRRSAALLIQLKLTTGDGACGVCLLTRTIFYLERMELRAGEEVLQKSNKRKESKKKRNCL